MTARRGAFVVLAFALVWLWVGTSTLAMPWRAVIGGVGVVALAATAWRVLRRPVALGNTRRFVRRRFWIAVAFEVIAGSAAGSLLGNGGLIGYLWPTIGIIVALHFIGLWWATGDRSYLTLMATMLAVNVIALFFPAGGAAMLAICGLGSATCLAVAVSRRA
jgi:hypothetical protein